MGSKEVKNSALLMTSRLMMTISMPKERRLSTTVCLSSSWLACSPVGKGGNVLLDAACFSTTIFRILTATRSLTSASSFRWALFRRLATWLRKKQICVRCLCCAKPYQYQQNQLRTQFPVAIITAVNRQEVQLNTAITVLNKVVVEKVEVRKKRNQNRVLKRYSDSNLHSNST